MNKPRSTQNYVNKRTARNEIVRQTTRQEEREMEKDGKLHSRRTDKEADVKHLEKRREEKSRGDRSTLEKSRGGAIKRKRQELQRQTNPRNCQQDGNEPPRQRNRRQPGKNISKFLGFWAVGQKKNILNLKNKSHLSSLTRHLYRTCHSVILFVL